MEKLQVAIEKARQRREGRGGGSQPPRNTEATTPNSGRKRAGPRLLPDDLVARWTALTEITLPRTENDDRRLVAHLPGLQASQFDILRTKVLTELRKNGWRRVAITSPTEHCGKTTTACNLAVAIARQGDLRVALFDLDLRRPAVARIFGATPPADIADLISRKVEFAQQAVRLDANLAISMALAPHADPTRLIAGKRIGEVVDEVEATFAPDVMIFDLPPILASDDASAFLRNVDCAILMAQAEKSTVKQIDISEREIAAQTNVLGVVLNQCRFDEMSRYAADYV